LRHPAPRVMDFKTLKSPSARGAPSGPPRSSAGSRAATPSRSPATSTRATWLPQPAAHQTRDRVQPGRGLPPPMPPRTWTSSTYGRRGAALEHKDSLGTAPSSTPARCSANDRPHRRHTQRVQPVAHRAVHFLQKSGSCPSGRGSRRLRAAPVPGAEMQGRLRRGGLARRGATGSLTVHQDARNLTARLATGDENRPPPRTRPGTPGVRSVRGALALDGSTLAAGDGGRSGATGRTPRGARGARRRPSSCSSDPRLA